MRRVQTSLVNQNQTSMNIQQLEQGNQISKQLVAIRQNILNLEKAESTYDIELAISVAVKYSLTSEQRKTLLQFITAVVKTNHEALQKEFDNL